MIELLSSGFYTSIQDLGRFDYTNFGVPLSGAMDQKLVRFANLLVGNAPQTAVFEMTFVGPKIKFHSNQVIAVTAPEAKIFVNSNPVKINHQFSIQSGDILEVKNIKNRAYLAISGGIVSDKILGSQSQYAPITPKSTVNKAEKFETETVQRSFKPKNASVSYDLSIYDTEVLQVYVLPEYELLSRNERNILTTKRFSISEQSNRMAYQLKETLHNSLKSIKSVPVMPGTIQLTPEGKIIILMRDAQVTGGYPRLFQLSEHSINILSQKPLNSQIKFEILKINQQE